MEDELKFAKYKPNHNDPGSRLVPQGCYASNITINSGRGIVPQFIVIKLENGYWATKYFNMQFYQYEPYISNYQTPEVQPNTGWYRTLDDAKKAFIRPKRTRFR